MPKCAIYLFRAKCVFFLPFPFSGFCTTGRVCFACEERVIFVNDVEAQPSRLQLQHLVLYLSFGSQLACAIWESYTHLLSEQRVSCMLDLSSHMRQRCFESVTWIPRLLFI